MRIILSRKGFDSAAGRVPSPIFPDGKLCSLPIPDDESPIRYGDVQWEGRGLGRIVETLTGRRIRASDGVHLDPDINPGCLPRKPGWRGLFGQSTAAQSHLVGSGVGAGDLFLFFGWFRQVEFRDGRLAYVPGAPDIHLLFGWLQIDTIHRVRHLDKAELAWTSYHPHVVDDPLDSNTLYVAAKQLRLPHLSVHLPGAGVFPTLKPALCLTAPGASRSTWRLPRWFYPPLPEVALTYHADLSRWRLREDAVYLDTVGRGQEFVLDCRHYPEAMEWLGDLFRYGLSGAPADGLG